MKLQIVPPMHPHILRIAAALAALTVTASAADVLPPTLMTIRGRLLASEDFSKPLAPFTGTPIGFASGFTGWRYNVGPKGGKWEVADGTFKGSENPEAHHPATASFGIPFKDAVVQCDVRLNDAPADARLYRSIFVKATDARDYVCGLFVSQSGLNAVPYDDTRINPITKQREKFPAIPAALPIKLDEWHTVVLEIKGEEVVGSLDGKSVTFSNPLIGVDKHSVMLGVATEASFRNFRVWEALPNPDWAKNKESMATASKPDKK